MSVYKVVQLIGTSETSWEEAARTAVETAGQHLENLRIAEVESLDMKIDKGRVVGYRAKVNVSFKYESGE